MKINKLKYIPKYFFTVILSLFFCIFFAKNFNNSQGQSFDFNGTVSVETLINGKRFFKYTKTGNEIKNYINYFAPLNSYNKNTAWEMPLEPCQLSDAYTLDRIGLDCMIAIPPPCNSDGSQPTGINTKCLIYADVFNESSTKKLDPKPCSSGSSGDKVNCLSTTNKNYCHMVDNPVLGINCKLAPCNLIPNINFRRPGVNCLADCNSSEGPNIGKNEFFMEGFNCLKSCKTNPASNKKFGHHCVLEFNEYVMPFCAEAITDFGESTKEYNKTSKSPFARRVDCIDYKDLPICIGANATLDKNNFKCSYKCHSDNDPKADLTCIKPEYSNSFCHTNKTLPSCIKYNCSQLSPEELSRSENTIPNQKLESDNVSCIASVVTDFSFKQLSYSKNQIGKNYTLPKKPCQSPDFSDTEAIVKVLGSSYYNPSPTGNYPFLQIVIDDKLNNNNDQNTINSHTPTHTNFIQSSIFDKDSLCKFHNISQKISCVDYRHFNKKAPYDCDSDGLSDTNISATPCNDSNSGSYCFCNQLNQEYCYKNKINCNSSKNQIYSICTQLNSSSQKPDPDTSVSWFFKPALDPKAIRRVNDLYKLYPLPRSQYHPLNNDSQLSQVQLNSRSDNIEMPKDVLRNHYRRVLGALSDTTSPGIEATNLGLQPHSHEYMCGMNNDIRAIPREDSVYYKSQVHSSYGLDNKIIHKFEVCGRFMSSGALNGESCGWRTCRANCTGLDLDWSTVCTKNCGADICQELQVITDESGAMTENCLTDQKSFNALYPIERTEVKHGRGGAYYKSVFKIPKCVAILRPVEHARIRSYIPDSSQNYICSVLEFMGVTNRHFNNAPYFDGDEFFLIPSGLTKDIPETKNGITITKTKTLFKKICVSGIYDSTSGNCINGFNSNDQDIATDVWRTAKIVRHILPPPNESNNWDMAVTRDGTEDLFYLNDDGRDYIDEFGSPDISTPSRSQNEPNMSIHRIDYNKKIKYETTDCIKFKLRHSSPIYNPVESRQTAPSLFIPPILIDDTCSTGAGTNVCETAEMTNFYTPAIKIVWGNKSSSYPVSDAPTAITNYKIIKIPNNQQVSSDYIIYLRNAGLNDYSGIQKTVFLKKQFDIEVHPNVCLYEKEGSGVNAKEYLIGCVKRKRAIGANLTSGSSIPNTPSNQIPYNEETFSVRFFDQAHTGLAGVNIEIPKLTSPDESSKLKKCAANVSSQGFPICIERHECTILNFECVENERDLISQLNLMPRDEVMINKLKQFSTYCNKVLLPKCNALKGLAPSKSNLKLNTSQINGFNAPAFGNYYGWFNEACITSGIEYLDNPSMKKYVVELIPENPSFRGKCEGYPGCTLHDFNSIQTLALSESQRIREATSKEINGNLCMEYTKFLQACAPKSFISVINPIQNDPFYLNDLDNPDISHRLRFEDTDGHSEFDIAFIGNTVDGTCNGFYQINNGNPPQARCTQSGWDSFTNSCIQFTCPELIVPSTGANDIGEYSSNYDLPKNFKSLMGEFHGYGNWNSLPITGINKQNGTFRGCITGYKKKNSTPTYIFMTAKDGTVQLSNYINNLNSPTDADKKHAILSSFKKIANTSYTVGISPSRKCNQLGQWEDVTNSCERIKCPALDFELPSDAGAYNLDDVITRYSESGGVGIISTSSSPLVSSPSDKITFTAPSNSSAPQIKVKPTSTNTEYLLLTSNGANINLAKDQIYVFEYKAPNYYQLDSSKDSVLKELWKRSGGASFPEGYAIRSKNYYYMPNSLDLNDQHLVSGECNSQLGYISLGKKPTMLCDSLGNWTNLNNSCVGDCSAVNSVIGNDPTHGFAIWQKQSPRVGESVSSSATSCISGTFAYPYSPPNDDEGNKKDYGINNINLDITTDSYDAIATTTNGADFTIPAGTLPAPSEKNLQGKSYALKIQQNFGSSSAFSDSSSGDKIITIFNDSAHTIDAPTDRVWSRINFASYGTPDYSSENNLQQDTENNCHFLYTKLVLALKCLGKPTCNISLSDFLNYDSYMPENCQQNFGNGLNGKISTIEEIGSTGGGGGGNSSAESGTINSVTVNGVTSHSLSLSENGRSFCDQNLHINLCNVTLANNGGLKVNITENDTGLFDGQSGYAIIKVAPTDDTPDESKTVYNYSAPGVYTITVPTLASVIGKTDIYFYVDYEIAGGGGGGGGEAIAQGTDGNPGSKVSGKFKIEAGKSFKVHIGGGGKAGKTGCFGSSPPAGAVSKFEDKYLPNKKFAIAKNQNFAKKSEGKTYDKIFAKNSHRQIFDDRVYYQYFVKSNSNNNYKKISKINNLRGFFKFAKYSFKSLVIKKSYAGSCNKAFDGVNYNWANGQVFNYACGSYQYGSIKETCNCPANGFAYFFEHGSFNGVGVQYGIGEHDLCKKGYSDYFSSMKLYGDIRVLLNVGCDRWSNEGAWGYYYGTSGGNGFDFDNYFHRYNDKISFIGIEDIRVCDWTTTGSCTNNACGIDDAFGISSASSGYNASGSNTGCNKANTSGTFDWYCSSNDGKATISRNGCSCVANYHTSGNNCVINTCTAGAAQGYDGTTTYTGASGTISCNKTNFDTSKTLSFSACDSNGATKTTTGGTCTCATGYYLSGSGTTATCERIKCNAPAQTGYSGSSTIDYNTSTTAQNCNGTNFNTSNQITFSACTTNGSNLTVSSGSCGCASGYYLSGSGTTATCPRIKCNAPAQAGYSGSSTIDYNTSTTAQNCDGTNFNTSNQIIFSACTANNSNLTVSSGSCGCASGYTLSGTGASATCKQNCNRKDSSSTYTNTANFGFTISSTDTTVVAGNGGTTTIACSGTGYATGTNNATLTCNSGALTLTTSCSCASGYHKISGKCVLATCTLPAQTGFASETISSSSNFTSGSISKSCQNNYTGTLNFTCIHPPTATTQNGTFTSGTCTCPSGFFTSGSGVTQSCSAITCSASARSGYTGSSTIAYTSSNTSINCNGTNFDNTNILTYDSCNSNGKTLTYSSGTCNCSSGYFLKTNATPSNNSCITNCTLSANDITKWGLPSTTSTTLSALSTSIACKNSDGYLNNNATIGCDGNTTSTSYSLTTNCNCDTTNNFHHPGAVTGHSVPTGSWDINNSCFKKCTVSANLSEAFGTGTSSYDVYEGKTRKNCTGTRYLATNASGGANQSSVVCTRGATVSAVGTLSIASSSESCPCATGFTKVNSGNEHTIPTGTSFFKGNDGSCFKICSISANDSNGIGTGTNSYQIYEGSNSKSCSGTGFDTSSNASISCNISGTATVTTGCSCASGYSKSTSSTHTKPSDSATLNYSTGTGGTCYKECVISAGKAHGWGVGTTGFNALQGINNINCSGARYATPATPNVLAISCSSTGSPTISGGCPCATGYSKSNGSSGHTKPLDNTTAGSEIGYFYLTPSQANSGTCFKDCSVTSTQSNTWGTGTSAYTVYEGTNTKGCTSNGFVTGNITVNCDSSGNATVTTACTKVGCPTSFQHEGVNGAILNKTGQNSISCDANGYHGNLDFYCSNSGSVASYTVTTSCLEYACTSSWTPPGISTQISATTGANSLTCQSSLGYHGTYSYYCDVFGNHQETSTCIAYSCNLSPDSLGGVHGIGFLARTGLSGNGSVDCDANGYSGTKYYTCGASGTVTSTGTCYANTCNPFTNPGVTGSITGKSGVSSNSCTAPGYSGILSFYCDDSNQAVILNSCTENVCDIPAGTGYSGKTNQSIAGSYACDNGYYGTVNWVCNVNGGNATVTQNCTRITCDLPNSAYSATITHDFTDDVWTNYLCKRGYKRSFDPISGYFVDPQYKCQRDADGANPSDVSIRNACVEVTCYIPGYGNVNYNNSNRHTITCNPSEGLFGTAILICDENGTITYERSCDRISCTLPSCSGGTCPANIQNSIEDGTRIQFSNNEMILSCKESHFFEPCPINMTQNCGSPKVRCTFDPIITTASTLGVPIFSGLPCQQSTCAASNDLNSVIDSTTVNWTGATPVSTTCKNGYYSVNPSEPPKYTCIGSGTNARFTPINPCTAVTCLPGNVFGMNRNFQLTWGLNSVVSCNKVGYSGTFEYNCTGSTTPGTFSTVRNNCFIRSCNLVSNNPTTFANYVVNGQNQGGDGGKISATITYLKGGNGGDSSETVTSGAGGGGGSASFIETLDGRIIVIAGGGGGGNGGGSDPYIIPNQSISPVADTKLHANFLGSYLIARMQSSPIQNSDPEKTSGLIYGKSDLSGRFNLISPNGMFINDIIFSSLGDPEANDPNLLNPNSVPTPTNIKYGTCDSSNSRTISETRCVNFESCEITDINELEFGYPVCSPELTSKNLAVLAGYGFKRPGIEINGQTKLIMEINYATMTYAPATLEHNKVYNFIDYGEFWLKHDYFGDIYVATVAGSFDVNSSPIKIKFHRTNTTLDPKFKIVINSGSGSTELIPQLLIKKIYNNKPSPISVGYIKENIFYILRLNQENLDNQFWEIREFSEISALRNTANELPKRTCMTTQLSENGMLGTVWSPSNSYCTNKCPGFNPTTKVGDDRIGAGATLHYTSDNRNGGIVYWDEASIGETRILTLSTRANPETDKLLNKGYPVFPRYLGSNNAKQFEKENGAQAGSEVFILERTCGANGVWSDPKPLCFTGGGTETDNPIGNFNNTRVYLNHSSHLDGSVYNNSAQNKRYIQADQGNASTAIGECLSGYSRITKLTNGLYPTTGNIETQLEPKLTFSCHSSSLSVNGNQRRMEDLTYLDTLSGSDCRKYCKMSDLVIEASSGISKAGSSNLFNANTLLIPGKSIELDCKTGFTYTQSYIRPNYLLNEINRINKNYTINWDTCQMASNGDLKNLRTTKLSTDFRPTDIQEKHIDCMNQIIFEWYWDWDSTTSEYKNVSKSGGPRYNNFIDGTQEHKTLIGYYYDFPTVHQNVRQNFDEDSILIANGKTELKKVIANPIRPQFECNSVNSGDQRDTANWSSVDIATDCRIADKCKITKYHGIRFGASQKDISKIAKNRPPGLNDIDDRWFPLRSFLYTSEVNACGSEICLNHGTTINIGLDTTCNHNKYGRCGYTVNWKSAWNVCANQYNAMWDMKRKYLKSASCNDGHLSVEWDFEDPNPGKSCDGEDGYSGSGCDHVNHVEEEKKPEQKFLGYSNDMDFSSFTDTFSKMRVTTASECSPPPEDYSPPISGFGNF